MRQETEPRRNTHSITRKNSKGHYTQQFLENRHYSNDSTQQKLDMFVRAFQQICKRLENTIDRQNNKINNMESTIGNILGSKLDKIILIGEKIHQSFQNSFQKVIQSQFTNNMFSQGQKIRKQSMDDGKVHNSLKQSIMNLNKSITSQIQGRGFNNILPPLPTVQRFSVPTLPLNINNIQPLLQQKCSLTIQKQLSISESKAILSIQSNKSLALLSQKQKYEIRKEVGQFYNSVASQYFDQYSKAKLTYEDMKIKFSYDIINYSLNVYKNWIQQYRFKNNLQYANLKRPQFYYLLNQSSKNVLQFLINKYPPSRRKRIDSQLSQKIKNTNNKYSVIKYDMLNNAKMSFGLDSRQTDFTKEIKIWLNMLINQTKKQYPMFKRKMKDIFINSDQSVDGRGMDSQLQYSINTKISQGTTFFTEKQLQSPGLQITSTQLLRILMKWCQELSTYFSNPEEKIYGNTSGFKSIRGTLPIKIPKSRLDQLAANLKNMFQNQIQPQLKTQNNNTGLLVTDLISMAVQGIQGYEFLNQRQISIVKLSQYLNQALKGSVLRFLNMTISRLVRLRSKYEDQRLQANINLVTFNVMDLLRCRCVGSKSQIYRIYKRIRQSDYFEIVRVKNKLNQTTRDILINLKIKHSFLICQVQLSLGEAQQQVNDHFCHFLYELERTNFGVLFQSASQICNLDPRIYYMSKHNDIKFRGSNQKKLLMIQNIKPSNKGPICSYFHNQSQMTKCTDNRPFCCSLCTSFKGGFNICLPYLHCPVCLISICPQCTIMISKNNFEYVQSYTSVGSNFHQLIRFFYPKHLYEEVGEVLTTLKRIPELLQKYPYILHMVVDNVGHKPTLYKRFKTKFTEAFSTLEENSNSNSRSLCWNYLIALKPFQRKKFDQLKDLRKFCLFKEWSELEQKLKLKNINEVMVVVDQQTQSVLIVDIVEQQKQIQACQIQQLIKKTIKQTNRKQTSILELTSKNLPNITLLSNIKNKQQIKVLNLWQNKIKNIDQLAEFTGLQQLYLRENEIQDIKPILRMTELQSAFICNNKITGQLPVLTFPNLYAFDISLNNFTSMDNIQKSDLRSLVFFRMVNTKIKQIPIVNLPKLQIFWFDHNEISSLKNLVLSTLPQLTKVSGTHNKIQELPRLAFLKLESLLLNKNRLTSIKNLTLSSLPNLRSLALHDNLIQGPLPLLELRSLKKLDLSNNRITSIPKDFLSNKSLPCLQTFEIKLNQISGDFPVIDIQSLRKLDISNNFITNVELLSVSKLPSLQVLDLSSNNIKGDLPILRLVKIRKLIISNNRISDIRNLGESKMPKLSFLKLNNNEIKSIIPKMYLQSLKNVDLSYNQIPGQIFLDYAHLVPSLEKVILKGNPESLKESIGLVKNLKVIHLISFSEATQ